MVVNNSLVLQPSNYTMVDEFYTLPFKVEEFDKETLLRVMKHTQKAQLAESIFFDGNYKSIIMNNPQNAWEAAVEIYETAEQNDWNVEQAKQRVMSDMIHNSILLNNEFEKRQTEIEENTLEDLPDSDVIYDEEGVAVGGVDLRQERCRGRVKPTRRNFGETTFHNSQNHQLDNGNNVDERNSGAAKMSNTKDVPHHSEVQINR